MVSTQRELLITALLLMLAFGVGATALLVSVRLGSPLVQIAIAAPAYFGALALALLLPLLFDLRDSRLIWSWALMWLATLLSIGTYEASAPLLVAAPALLLLPARSLTTSLPRLCMVWYTPIAGSLSKTSCSDRCRGPTRSITECRRSFGAIAGTSGTRGRTP